MRTPRHRGGDDGAGFGKHLVFNDKQERQHRIEAAGAIMDVADVFLKNSQDTAVGGGADGKGAGSDGGNADGSAGAAADGGGGGDGGDGGDGGGVVLDPILAELLSGDRYHLALQWLYVQSINKEVETLIKRISDGLQKGAAASASNGGGGGGGGSGGGSASDGEGVSSINDMMEGLR